MRWSLVSLIVLLGVYFVARAAVELVIVNPTKPETYRHDWGGPTYVGVILVHVLPAAIWVAAATWYAKQRRRVRA